MEPSPASTAPYLKRVLGLRDLVLLGIVAVFNPNLVPPVAAGGFPSLFLWAWVCCAFSAAGSGGGGIRGAVSGRGQRVSVTKKAFFRALVASPRQMAKAARLRCALAVASSVRIGLSFTGKDVQQLEACI